MRRLHWIFALILMTALVACGKAPAPETASGTSSANSPATTPAPGASNEASNSAASSPTLTKRPTEVPRAAAVVPEGTVLTVRLNQALSSKTSQSGQSFTATVSKPIQVNGAVAIPQGSTVSGIVTDATPAGRIKGASVLRLTLKSVEINGKTYDIATAPVTRSVAGKGKRSAAMIGGGAGAGALIGGLLGGGKGAAIGAASGAGAGTAGAAFTGNRDVSLPAETPVSFRLSKSLEVKS